MDYRRDSWTPMAGGTPLHTPLATPEKSADAIMADDTPAGRSMCSMRSSLPVKKPSFSKELFDVLVHHTATVCFVASFMPVDLELSEKELRQGTQRFVANAEARLNQMYGLSAAAAVRVLTQFAIADGKIRREATHNMHTKERDEEVAFAQAGEQRAKANLKKAEAEITRLKEAVLAVQNNATRQVYDIRTQHAAVVAQYDRQTVELQKAQRMSEMFKDELDSLRMSQKRGKDTATRPTPLTLSVDDDDPFNSSPIAQVVRALSPGGAMRPGTAPPRVAWNVEERKKKQEEAAELEAPPESSSSDSDDGAAAVQHQQRLQRRNSVLAAQRRLSGMGLTPKAAGGGSPKHLFGQAANAMAALAAASRRLSASVNTPKAGAKRATSPKNALAATAAVGAPARALPRSRPATAPTLRGVPAVPNEEYARKVFMQLKRAQVQREAREMDEEEGRIHLQLFDMQVSEARNKGDESHMLGALPKDLLLEYLKKNYDDFGDDTQHLRILAAFDEVRIAELNVILLKMAKL